MTCDDESIQDQGIDVETEKTNLREIQRNLPITISVDLPAADIILRALSFRMRAIGGNSGEFKICKKLCNFLESKVREVLEAKTLG